MNHTIGITAATNNTKRVLRRTRSLFLFAAVAASGFRCHESVARLMNRMRRAVTMLVFLIASAPANAAGGMHQAETRPFTPSEITAIERCQALVTAARALPAQCVPLGPYLHTQFK